MASLPLGPGTLWAVESRTARPQDKDGRKRVYIVARLEDGSWVCSGHYLSDHCGPDKECWHVKERRAEWEQANRLRLVKGGAA